MTNIPVLSTGEEKDPSGVRAHFNTPIKLSGTSSRTAHSCHAENEDKPRGISFKTFGFLHRRP
jgi:hypothetical protein